MKTLFLSAAAMFMVAVSSNAHPKNKVVSNLSKAQFSRDFPRVSDAVWTRTANFDEVTFKTRHHVKTAYYDVRSHLVGTTETKQFSDLPANAQQKILKEYKGYDVVSVLRYDDNENNDTDIELFGIQTDAPDSYFIALSKEGKELILQVSDDGNVQFFEAL